MAGSSSRALAAACDDFVVYDALPGVPVFEPEPVTEPQKNHPAPQKTERTDSEWIRNEWPDPQPAATRAADPRAADRLEKDDVDWLHNSALKAQMKRMDPSFSEKSLGFRSFSDFLRSRTDVVELDESSTTRMVRLRAHRTER